MNFNDKHLEILHRVQPHLKDLYNRATEIMPPLYMSDRCTEVIGLLQLEDINDETKDSIKNIQRKLLSRLLKETLQNVPFYQKNVKLDPDSINPGNAIETLFEFPFISKQDIMNSPADFVSKKFIKFFLIHITTSGSTGRGLGLYKAFNEIQIEHAFIDDLWSTLGCDKKAKILRLGADAIVPVDRYPCQIKGRRLFVSPRHLNDNWLPQIMNEIETFNPDFIHSYPSCLEILARYVQDNNRELKIKGILLASEEVRNEQLDLFSNVFDTPICFFYGASEQVLLGYGCYDGKSICYHFNPLYGIVENLKDEYGLELVGTGLWNYAMPLIRYRTEDYGELNQEISACGVCGKSTKTVQHLDGRRQNFLTTKYGTKFSGLSVYTDYFTWDYVSSFQYVQKKPGEIEFHIVPKDNFTDEVEMRILEAQKKKLSDWFEPIKIIKETEIPLTKGGKRRLVEVVVKEKK
jgi:phenylacetate-CoA ligase